MSGKGNNPKKGNPDKGKRSILPGPTGVRRPALKSLTQTPEERRLIEALMRQQPDDKDDDAGAGYSQPDPTEILNGFIQRFRDIDAAYQQASSQSGFGSVSSLGSSSPVTQPPQPPFGRESSQDLRGFSPPPTPLREGEGVEGLPDIPRPPLDRTNSVASTVSAFASSQPDISEEEMLAAGISKKNVDAALALPDIAVAAAPYIAEAEAAAPAIASALQPQQLRQQADLLRDQANQGLLDNIDNEFNELIYEIFNGGAARGCLFIISKLNSLFALIISAIGKGLGFAIKYPKLALLLIGLAYLQSSTCAFIINKTIKFVWWITTYLFGMTTAGQKIAGFIRQIIGIYKWCEASGIDSFAKFQQLVEAVAELQKNMGSITDGIAELRRLAASLGISVEELMQIILSMQSTFGQPAPGSGVGRIIWDMLGGIAVPVVMERLGAGAAAAGPGLLGNGMGGGKRKKTRKNKPKTSKKRKSKSNKKGKTKTRRR